MSGRVLDLPFYRRRDTLEVARDLLGRTLCRRLPDGLVVRGRLLEVEAYDGPSDRASHASRGLTPRTAPMFEEGGIAYVYLVYGMHHCLNFVTGPRGYPAAVLVRAAGLEEGAGVTGPARLTRAFRVDLALNRTSLLGPDLWLEDGEPVPDMLVARSPRIGVDYAGAWAKRPFRFFVKGHPAVSRPSALPSPR